MAKTAIPMVNLRSQYLSIKEEIDRAIQDVINSTQFINGEALKQFESNFADYLGVKHVIGVANGTDALQVAFMALGLEEGDEVITPSFTYAATAEILGLLKLTPVFVDVDPTTFNIDPRKLEKSITAKTKAIIPVHLYGSPANLPEILQISNKYGLYVIEDTAQAAGAELNFSDGSSKKCGTIGDMGCFSFFPSKNLGCYGDGGAVCTNDDKLATRVRTIARHGQSAKYKHDILGCNSRLDTLQAAILDVKLKYLDAWNTHRRKAAAFYSKELSTIDEIVVPGVPSAINHVFHQYTIKVKDKRDALTEHLKEHGIPSVVYYRIPLHRQKAFMSIPHRKGDLSETDLLCEEVLSLPIDSNIDRETQFEIVKNIKSFFNQ